MLGCEVEVEEDSNESVEEDVQGTLQLELFEAMGVEEVNAEWQLRKQKPVHQPGFLSCILQFALTITHKQAEMYEE